MQDEENLVRRSQKGDEEAFVQLYEAYFNKIYRYVVLKIGNEMEAEDITQQVFLHVLRAIRSFKWRGRPFSAWLFRIAHNQVVDYLRKKSKRTTVTLDETLVSDGSDPQDTVEKVFDIAQLTSAMQRLTQAQREVLSLRFTGELSTAEVTRVIGRSQGAVKALQHSAIVTLRKVLAQE